MSLSDEQEISGQIIRSQGIRKILIACSTAVLLTDILIF